ncbi:MAG: trypsin-like peptidase domain-containing protein [Nitrospinae bacterium]|nr:trypsin-like peptidase domain-containing protein [Nitrospinota bacterium]
MTFGRFVSLLAGASLGLAIALNVFKPQPSIIPVAPARVDGQHSSAKSDWVLMAQKVRPSVARVTAYVEQEPGSGDESPGSFAERLQTLFAETKYQVESVGSGVVMDREGRIITNHHLVANAKKITVKIYGSPIEEDATLLGKDPLSDIAVLRAKGATKAPPAVFAGPAAVLPGQFVALVGNPFEFEGSVSLGVVSALGRSGLGLAGIEDFIQTDASINPGDSGGPLCDMSGRVVGINTAIYGPGSGIGFAIPAPVAVAVARELLSKGSISRGRIGVKLQPLTEDLARSLRFNRETGALVTGIERRSPAERAGLKAGDIVVSFDGRRVDGPGRLRSFVLSTSPGSDVEIGIIRDGVPVTFSVVVGGM